MKRTKVHLEKMKGQLHAHRGLASGGAASSSQAASGGAASSSRAANVTEMQEPQVQEVPPRLRQ